MHFWMQNDFLSAIKLGKTLLQAAVSNRDYKAVIGWADLRSDSSIVMTVIAT